MDEHLPFDYSNLADELRRKQFKSLRRKFKDLEPADIAAALKDATIEETISVLRLTSTAQKANVFSYLSRERQEILLEALPEDMAGFLLNEMDADDRTALLGDVSPDLSRKYLLKLDPEERKIAYRLLSYPESSVGRIMSPEFVAIGAGLRVSEAIEQIRWNAAVYSEEILQQIFVIDREQKYLGDTSIGALFIADNNSLVDEIITSSFPGLSPYDDQQVAVDAFRKYDKTTIPVVSETGKLLGVVTADDVFDVAEEEATEDIQQFGGAAVLEESYFHTPVLTLLRKRAGWLALLFFGGTLSSHALKSFDIEHATYAFLIVFLPLVLSSGGNSGSQAASLVIRGIAVKEFELRDWMRVLSREFLSGLGLGCILGSFGFIFSYLWGMHYPVGVVVFVSLICVVTFGAVLGSMLPFLLKLCRLDPAVSSSPLIASLSDAFGIIVYFNIAHFAMRFLG